MQHPARKFLFETSFDPLPPPVPAEPENAPVLTEELANAGEAECESVDASEPPVTREELEIARQAAWDEGYETAKQEVLSSIEEKQAVLLEKISTQLSFIEESCEEQTGQFVTDAVRTARQLVSALSPQLARMGKDAEIAALLEQTFRGLRSEPALLVVVHPASLATTEALATRITTREGMRCALTVQPDDSLDEGDCIIRWEHGRAERLRHTIERKVEALITALVPEAGKQEAGHK